MRENLGMPEERWPALPSAAWRDTAATLQLWTQIAGKVRLAIVGGGAGTGLSAKCAEMGGIDLIIIYNSGRVRRAGRGRACWAGRRCAAGAR